MDKLTHFKTFAAIVEKGSLKNAANYLNLTPSAVSKHLSTLENYYCADLIVRDAKHLRITAEGHRFYAQCKEVIRAVTNAEDVFIHTSNYPQIIRLTIPQVLAQGNFLSALKAFREVHPNCRLDVITSNQNLDLKEHEIDFAFRGGKLADSQLKTIPLLKTRSILCAANSYTQTLEAGDPMTLINRDLLIPSYLNLSDLRQYLSQIGVDKPLTQFTSFDDAFTYKNAVMQGMGIGLFLDVFVREEIGKGQMIHIDKPFSFDFREITISMVFNKNVKLAGSHESFKNFIKEYFSEY